MNLENFEFREVEGVMTLWKYFGNEKKVVIPDEFEGKPVTVIGKAAFGKGRRTLDVEELVLPKHLKIIKYSACSHLSNMKKITLPEDLEEISSFAFAFSTSLEEIMFPSSIKSVKADGFAGCTSLKKVISEDEATKVSANAFGNGEFLEEISFSLLKCLDIPIQVRLLTEKILNFSTLPEEEQAEIQSHLKQKINLRKELLLSGNVGIISFLLELKVKLTLEFLDVCLESSIQGENTEVTAIFLDYKNKNFAKNVQEDYNRNKELVEIGLERPTPKQFKEKWKCSKVEGGLSISEYKGSETQVTIPAELADGTKIVGYGRKISGKLQPVLLGAITHLTIEAPLTAIEAKEFVGRRDLVSLVLPDTIEFIGEYAFEGCASLENLNLPPKIKVISKSALEGCRSLTEITIPESVEVIESCAFEGCRNLMTVNFLGKEPDIKESVFLGCESLANEDGFVIVGTTLFDYFADEKILTIPDGISKISSRGMGHQNCQEVIFPDSLEYIGDYCFFNCQKLTTISMGNRVKTIGNYVFQDCPNLNPFKISENLEELGVGAFSGDLKLIDEEKFLIIGGFLIQYCGEEAEIVIPEGVKTILPYAFYNKYIEKVTFPSTLEVIKTQAFYVCRCLLEIIFSENLKEIEDHAFFKSNKPKDIQIPDGVKLGIELFE